MITLSIRVKPWVRKYLVHLYGEDLKVNKGDHVGMLLYYILQKNYVDKNYDYFMKSYSSSFNVEISDFNAFKKGVRHLSSYSTVHFNTFIESIIKDKFHSYVSDAISMGTRQKDAINDFMKKYSFNNEDIPYDTLLKSYQRYQEKLKEAA